MRTSAGWTDKIQDADGTPQPIYDLIYTDDGQYLVAGAGAEILIYEASTGTLTKSLKGHKDTVTCLCPLKGGGFASGGADKQVIIWSKKWEGTLKYAHGDSVQTVRQNPVIYSVLSCTASDFGIWAPELKNVNKNKVPSRICSSAYTSDGQHFALGYYNGHVSIRARSGEEKVRIERGNLPIWALSWSPSTEEDTDILAVADWSQKLSFFQLTGRQLGKDRVLDYDPCSIEYFASGEYLIMGGSDRQVSLWTCDGVKIGSVCTRDGWVWAARQRPGQPAHQPTIAVASNDGSISTFTVNFNTVHGIYSDRYAFRQNMTDVVIQNLVSDQKARIKCRDYVKKIAVYKDRLAVQLSDRVIIYELFHDENGDMHYRIKEKLAKKMECQLLVVTSMHLLLCLDSKLSLYLFSGEKEREWHLDTAIRYIKVIGGPKGREGILVGLKDGAVLKIFVDNAFAIPLITHSASIRCLDLNLSKTKLAVVDDTGCCVVYRVASKELVYTEPNASAVAWNSEVDDMVCFSGNGSVSIKVSTFPVHSLKMNGFVVGFKGSRVYSLNQYSMSTIDVPQTTPMERYIERQDFASAYSIACLGVPVSDWKKLGVEALEHLSFDVAMKSFVRIRDTKFLDIVKVIEKVKEGGRKENDYILAEIHAYSDKFHEAARLYKRSGDIQRAIEMYTELNLWEYATQLAEETNAKTEDILKRKAQMQEDRKDILAAATTYEQVGDFLQAVELLGPGGYTDRLIDIVRKVKMDNRDRDVKVLNRCVFFFRKANHYAYATETLKKLEDIPALLKLLTDLHSWEEAFKVAETYPDHQNLLYLPYGSWLASNDRFDEAQEYYVKAGRPDEAVRVLTRLAEGAIVQERFEDAAAYYFTLSKAHLEMVPSSVPFDKLNQGEKEILLNFLEYRETARLYFAYSHIFRYVEDPFIFTIPDALLEMAKVILCRVDGLITSVGISKIYAWYTVATIAKSRGGNKLARLAYDKLLGMKLDPKWQPSIEMAALKIRCKEQSDAQELFSTCHRCHELNAPYSAQGDFCPNCYEPRVRSIYSFTILPILQFIPEKGLDEKQVLALISEESPIIQESGQTSTLNAVSGFMRHAQSEVLTRQQILELDPSAVFIKRFKTQSVPTEYYRVLDPDISVVLCPQCQEFLLEEEWLYQVLSEGKCPFCKFPHKIADE